MRHTRQTDDWNFFFPVVIKLSRRNKKTANFPPEPKTDTPARQTTGTFFFFPVVIKLFRRNKKTANFPPEPKTDTPARQTTGTFFRYFPPEPKTDTTAQLEKKFLQPTRSVGRFLQPTRSECSHFFVSPSVRQSVRAKRRDRVKE